MQELPEKYVLFPDRVRALAHLKMISYVSMILMYFGYSMLYKKGFNPLQPSSTNQFFLIFLFVIVFSMPIIKVYIDWYQRIEFTPDYILMAGSTGVLSYSSLSKVTIAQVNFWTDYRRSRGRFEHQLTFINKSNNVIYKLNTLQIPQSFMDFIENICLAHNVEFQKDENEPKRRWDSILVIWFYTLIMLMVGIESYQVKKVISLKNATPSERIAIHMKTARQSSAYLHKPNIYYDRAQKHLDQYEYETAIKELQIASLLDPHNKDVLVLIKEIQKLSEKQ